MSSRVQSIREAAARWLGIAFSPLAISFLSIIFTNFASKLPVSWWLWVIFVISAIIAVVFYMLAYTSAFEDLLIKYEQVSRANRYKKPRVLILDGTLKREMNEVPPKPLHTDRQPEDWKDRLTKLGWKINIGPVQNITDGPLPDIVINPFGELYPESNIDTRTTFQEIRNYVWNGGVFVNVAGVPFWYYYDPRTCKQSNAYRFEPITDSTVRSIPVFLDAFPNLSIVMNREAEMMNCKQSQDEASRFGNIVGEDKRIGVFRPYDLQHSQLLTLLRDEEDRFSIIGALRYGKGCFLLCGVFMTRDNGSFSKVVEAINGWAKFETKRREI